MKLDDAKETSDWVLARSILSALSMGGGGSDSSETDFSEDEEADGILIKAYGWCKTSARYYRDSRKEHVIPSPASMRATLECLESVVGRERVWEIISKFPYTVAFEADKVEIQLNRIVGRFKIDAAMLATVVVRRPDLLGMQFDCKRLEGGRCRGKCGKCFSSRRAGLNRNERPDLDSLLDW